MCKRFVLLIVLATLTASPSFGQTGKKSKEQSAVATRFKNQVAGLIADAQATTSSNPRKALDMLRSGLSLLDDRSQLPSQDRIDLIVQIEDAMREAREKLAALEPPAKPLAAPGRVSPSASSVNVGVTPTVSADRRFVRIGFSGAMTMITPTGPLVPIQIPVPTILYGPGKGFTVTRPEVIFQQFLPLPKATRIQLNSAATVPDGGVAVLGGSSSSLLARNEFGVPGLSRVPYVGRLFRNTTSGQDLAKTQVSVRARIISLEEEEQKLLAQER